MSTLKNLLRPLIPYPLLHAYHAAWALGSAALYGNPSRKLIVIGVTGTKGKSSVSELIYRTLTEAGYKTALASTIHFTYAGEDEPNLFKMTMPGHGYLQRFMRRALERGCTHAVIEMTSEGARQRRHLGIDLDALVFTNLQPEHLESHGSMEAYANAKLELARALARSPKRPRIIVANADDEYGPRFLATSVEKRVPFSLADAEPYQTDDRSVRFVWRGELFTVPLPGVFNLRNCLATIALGEALGIPLPTIKRALERVDRIAGRAERIEQGQPFAVIVDYAHTPDSLQALYEAYSTKRIIALLGSTGGGRDQWKRPQMGRIAQQYADVVVLANEDPYDEDPHRIVRDIAAGLTEKKPHIILDRREAVAYALRQAKPGDAVLITGKGTDPFIMGPRGTKEPWSDVRVAREELQKLGYN
jgi:UDP-N-acetylmuramoyl-L-alanyl-D-glutamate--2,6-diaminopimelate ligase